ncbi:uncharacterized protein LOC113558677 isoform X2 [Rhopalosiphum maidis]|uniref:uncharacterized protein LOC113558677 isoform X2 n=1 Tax=Rhopalosiphum maidis TaxID=43146 RepID=UPI000EFEAE79|nr:uncharacterized protein LOC113558677 isoform X2 [Rhopalosiphum maidis]
MILYKYWVIIITSKISETWIIKLIDGIIEFDQKLTSSLPTYFKVQKRKFSIYYWNKIFISTSLYYIALTFLYLYLWPVKIMDITTFVLYFIRVSFIIDFTLIVSSYFYLRNLENRFETLNDLWRCLPEGLLAVPDECSEYDIVIMVDNIRTLHAVLSDILRIFICFKYSSEDHQTLKKVLKETVPFILSLKNIIFTMSIITAASRVNDKKRHIISYLRLTKISKLSVALKIQVKMFMNQISVFESDEMTAFGIFSINMNLVISIIILLISGISTMIQMKEHPMVLQTINTTRILYQKWNISV